MCAFVTSAKAVFAVEVFRGRVLGFDEHGVDADGVARCQRALDGVLQRQLAEALAAVCRRGRKAADANRGDRVARQPDAVGVGAVLSRLRSGEMQTRSESVRRVRIEAGDHGLLRPRADGCRCDRCTGQVPMS